MKLAHISLQGACLLSLVVLSNTQAAPQVDPNFHVQLNQGAVVHAIAVDDEEQVLLGGEFQAENGRAGFARFTPSGELDATFGSAVGADGGVRAISVNAAGEMVIGGRFHTVDGIVRPSIARLLTGGAVDTSFDAGTGTSSRVVCVAFGPNGEIYTGGPFRRVNGTDSPYLCQFDDLGALSSTFTPAIETSFAIEAGIEALAVQPDGKILAGGVFNSARGAEHLVRFDPDGSIDDSFAQDNGPILYTKAIVALANGKILVAGLANSDSLGFVRRLNADGSVDSSFNAPAFDSYVNAIAVDAGGRIIVGGAFRSVAGLGQRSLARLQPNGELDRTWSIETDGDVLALALQADGKLLAGGSFRTIGGVERPAVARITEPTLTMHALGASASGEFALRLQAQAGRTYVVESSDDLSQWSTFSTNTATNAGLEILDRAAKKSSRRFFRARQIQD